MTLNCPRKNSVQRQRTVAMTLVELMVAIGVGSIVLTIVSILTVVGARSFASVGNYAILNQKSSVGVDEITRELRQASGVLAWQTNGFPKWLLVTNSNPGGTPYTVKYSLDADRQMTMKKSNETEPDVLLDGCDSWNFVLLNGAPTATGFNPAANANDCKIISMSWKCSRFMGRTNSVNTEAVQSARIVMRNKK